MTSQKSFLSLFFLQPTNGLLLPLILLDRKRFCHPIYVHDIERVYCHCCDLSLLFFFQWKLRTIVAIFQQYVYCNAIEFRSVCNVRLHKLSRIKKLFPYLCFLDYLCFPLFPLVFPGCPVFVCFPFCPLFFFCLSLFPVFALCFPLFSLFLSVFSCYPMFFLFSSQSVFPCSTVFICFLLFPGAFFSVFSCFTLFLWILLSFPVLLCFSLFSWLAPKNSGSRNEGKQGKT